MPAKAPPAKAALCRWCVHQGGGHACGSTSSFSLGKQENVATACEGTACEGAACEGTCAPSPNIMFCTFMYVFHIHVTWVAGRWVGGIERWWVGGLVGWWVNCGAGGSQFRHSTIHETLKPPNSPFVQIIGFHISRFLNP